MNPSDALERRFDIRSLFEFSSVINGTNDLSFILGHLLLTVMGKLLSTRGIVLLADRAGGGDAYRVTTVKGLPGTLLGTRVVLEAFPDSFPSPDKLDGEGWKFLRSHRINWVLPLRQKEGVVGAAGFASGPGQDLPGGSRAEYLESLAGIAAAAISRARAQDEADRSNLELQRRLQELNTLFEMSKELNAVFDAESTLRLLMYSVMGQVGVNRCFLSLVRDGRLEPVINRLDTPVPDELAPFLLTLTRAVTVEGIRKQRPAALLRAIGIEALVPLRSGTELKGVFGAGARLRGASYDGASLDYLASLGNLAVIALENSRLFREALEKQKLEDELVIAREIQKGLLPSVLPAIPGYSIAAENISSRQVGGDYYDAIDLGGGRMILAIGDVSGKGPPASILMASLQASIRALVPLGLPLAELTGMVNDLMVRNTTQGRFVTFFWMILDAPAGTLTYVNAGHNPPLICREDGTIDRLEEGGLVLGVMKPPMPYQEAGAVLRKGDALLLYTDGVSEAMSPAAEEYGDARLEKELIRLRSRQASDICREVVASVTAFAAGAGQADDITLVVLKKASE